MFRSQFVNVWQMFQSRFIALLWLVTSPQFSALVGPQSSWWNVMTLGVCLPHPLNSYQSGIKNVACLSISNGRGQVDSWRGVGKFKHQGQGWSVLLVWHKAASLNSYNWSIFICFSSLCLINCIFALTSKVLGCWLPSWATQEVRPVPANVRAVS